MLYLNLGQCDRAEPLLVRALEGRIRRLGASHSFTSGSKQHVALLQEVRPVAEAYRRTSTSLGADHPDTLAARYAFAALLRDRGQGGAAAYHLQALVGGRLPFPGHCRCSAPSWDPNTRHSDWRDRAWQYAKQKLYAEAEPLLVEGYENSRNTWTGDRSVAPGPSFPNE